MANVTTLLDLEAMMDDDLDSFEETPDFCNPPGGDYVVISKGGKIRSYTDNEGTEIQSIQVTIAVVETLELSTDEEPPVADGSLFTISFKGTDKGVGDFKREIRKMAGLPSSKGINLRSAFELLESGLTFNVRISYSKYTGRDGEEKSYLRMRILPPTSE